MKRTLLALAALVVVAAAVVLLVVAASEPAGPATTDTTSSEIAALEDRRAFLDDYLGPMPYADLEDVPPDSALVFSVVYWNNNSGFVPGPSDWTIEVVARVPPDSFDTWRRGLGPADSLDTSWLQGLGAGPRVDGIDEWFGGPFRMVGLDRENGVVAHYATTN